MKRKEMKGAKEILAIRGFDQEGVAVYPTAFGVLSSMGEEVFTDLEKIKNTDSLTVARVIADRLLDLYGMFFKEEN